MEWLVNNEMEDNMSKYIVTPAQLSCQYEDRQAAIAEARRLAGINVGTTYYVCKLETHIAACIAVHETDLLD